MASSMQKELVSIGLDSVQVQGMLELPQHPIGLVLFAHGSGSSRLSPRNNYVAAVLREAKLGTLLMDLLTTQEDRSYQTRFDIALLAQRLYSAASWARGYRELQSLPLGLFGASTGAAAALQVAAMPDAGVQAVVSRGGRPDLAGPALEQVAAPTLLIVGGADDVVIELNRAAYAVLKCEKQLAIVPGATHLFEEAGALETVAELARDWFVQYLTRPPVHA